MSPEYMLEQEIKLHLELQRAYEENKDDEQALLLLFLLILRRHKTQVSRDLVDQINERFKVELPYPESQQSRDLLIAASVLNMISSPNPTININRISATENAEAVNASMAEIADEIERSQEPKEAQLTFRYFINAVLDSRTCEVCRGKHGETWNHGDDTPPFHPNCRCFLDVEVVENEYT